MKHNSVTVKNIPLSELDKIDTTSYDMPYVLENAEKSLSLKVSHIQSGSKHMPVHYFLPWGWDLDVPVLRQYNIYLQKNYYGDMYFYSLQHIGLRKLDKTEPVLEQLAHRWLKTNIEQGLIKSGQPILIEGISLGGAVASVIASIAHEYDITLGNLNIFEPAGMTKKSIFKMLDAVSNDTRQDYVDAFGGGLSVRKAKTKMLIAAIKNSNVQLRAITEIAAGNLDIYVNNYLKTQAGEVHIGHGAESTFMTFDDLDEFSSRLIDSSRVQSFDFEGCPHGFSGKALGLSDWYGTHTAKHQ